MDSKTNNNNSKLLQIAVVGLAIVSFFTTANGMSAYIFKNDTISYAASAAIQGILLSLNMNLPGYLERTWKTGLNFFIKLFLCFTILSLTLLTIFCSSWFSYVYIAEVVHEESWETDSMLLVQQTYRTELYNAQNYTYAYRIYLEEELGERLLSLQEQTDKIVEKDQLDNLNIDWDTEKEIYGDIRTTAGNYMTTVIDAMNNALGEDASPNSHDMAIKAVTDAQDNIANRMVDIQQELDNLNNQITRRNERVADLTRSINNAVAGADTTSMITSLNSQLRQIESATTRQTDLQEEYNQLDNASLRLSFYESRLGLTDSTSSISIQNTMQEMQSEFFKSEPDEIKLLNTATSIFENLRNAASYNDTSSYTELLVQMNQFILNLKDYINIKNIESALEDLVEDLRNTKITEGILAVNETSNDENDSSAAKQDNKNWKQIWQTRLENLKSQISAMPVYTDTTNTDENGNIIYATQSLILSSYDRNESSSRLDDMIRLYITVHNALYQGLIYLNSPYRMLALFSLFLAFSFDLAGFIFGFIIQSAESREISRNRQDDMSTKLPGVRTGDKNKTDKVSWSIIKAKNDYIVLTGDYKKENQVYIYDVFVNGLYQEWFVEDQVPYMSGIYIQDKTTTSKGTPISQQEQEIKFTNQDGDSQDGIYSQCRLFFDEGSLILIKKTPNGEESHYLTNISDYVPVHIYNPIKVETLTIPANQLAVNKINAKIAVVALNNRGTRVAAIYIIQSSS